MTSALFADGTGAVVRGTGPAGSRGREQASALVTAVFNICFPKWN